MSYLSAEQVSANAIDRAAYRLLPDGRLVLRDAELHDMVLERRAEKASRIAAFKTLTTSGNELR